jgi:hypothetical protein
LVGGFDGKGDAFPAEMPPWQILSDDVCFQLGSAKDGTPNAVTTDGQAMIIHRMSQLPGQLEGSIRNAK